MTKTDNQTGSKRGWGGKKECEGVEKEDVEEGKRRKVHGKREGKCDTDDGKKGGWKGVDNKKEVKGLNWEKKNKS